MLRSPNLLSTEADAHNGPTHHAKSTVGKGFDIKISTYPWVELHSLTFIQSLLFVKALHVILS